MQQVKQFLQGKKTYLSAAFIALVACFAWWFHVVGYTEALSLLGVAGGMAGLGAKSQRTAEAILAILGDVQEAQSKVPPGQKIDVEKFATDLSKQVMKQFAQGNLVRSTPVGAVSNVVPAASFAPTCIFCGQSISWNGGICTEPKNDSAAGADGQKRHVFMIGDGSPAK